MARKLASDKVLFVALVALSLFGCVMIYSASAVSAAETAGSPYRYLLKQMAALVVGGLAAYGLSRADYRRLASPAVVYGAYGLAFLLCIAVLFRPPINAARRRPTARSMPSSDFRSSASMKKMLTSRRMPASTANIPSDV